MTPKFQVIKPEAPPPMPLPQFVETPSARAMLLALRRARARGRMTMIVGGTGIGKTRAMWQVKHESPNAYVIEARAQEGGSWNLAYRLCELLGLPEPNSRNMPRVGDEIAEALGPESFVMIDEAQYLVQENPRGPDNWMVLEWLRALSEKGGFGVAFIGDRRLLDGLKGADQLRRRTHPRVVIHHASEADVAAFCRAAGLTDPAIVKVLAKVAKRYGGLGDVAEVLTTARDMAGAAEPGAHDIRAALEFLELDCGRTRHV